MSTPVFTVSVLSLIHISALSPVEFNYLLNPEHPEFYGIVQKAQQIPCRFDSRLKPDRDVYKRQDVYNILLQVFDDGRLTDGKGRVVDFTNTIIIATSNLGSDIIQRRLKARGAAGEEYEKTKAGVMDVLRGHFRPEFLNRIDEIIVFHALGKEEIRHIVGLQDVYKRQW